MNPPNDGQKRIVIENITPIIDGGRFPVKRVAGDAVVVQADVFTDGHDTVAAVLLFRREHTAAWAETAMKECGNDRWEGSFPVGEPGNYGYRVQGWIDIFATWRKDFAKKHEAGLDLPEDIAEGLLLIEAAADRATAPDSRRLRKLAGLLSRATGPEQTFSLAMGRELSSLMRRWPDRSRATLSEPELQLTVERRKALFSSWYELFPRSCSAEPDRHATLAEVAALLPDIAKMGFDVLYLPPIHPVGKTARKGKNNTGTAASDDPGCPWAIGSHEGGHTAVNPLLGTLEQFKLLVAAAAEHGIEIALDLAYQCSPDHPFVTRHPSWFKKRPDGSIKCAENPPKKYEDVVPFDFETEDWPALWQELKNIVLFWIGQGIHIFRVDNPHTKPFAFWEWMIREVRREHPDTLFLAEAFTRPKVMARLAKAGFSQSYTYFTWRNTKHELIDYMTDITRAPLRDSFRPNFWPNTPDILPEFLQYGGRSAFMIRLILAATLSSSYGIYGPAFELCVADALPGREEYNNSEKYEIATWDRTRPESLRHLLARINRVRRENPALQETTNLRFCPVDNDYLLAYIKTTEDLSNTVLCVVNLDPFHVQEGLVQLPLRELQVDPGQPCLARDLIGNDNYLWQGDQAYVKLDPAVMPAHILQLRMRLRRESDFDYFM